MNPPKTAISQLTYRKTAYPNSNNNYLALLEYQS